MSGPSPLTKIFICSQYFQTGEKQSFIYFCEGIKGNSTKCINIPSAATGHFLSTYIFYIPICIEVGLNLNTRFLRLSWQLASG